LALRVAVAHGEVRWGWFPNRLPTRGTGPHKGSHTAVAVTAAEEPLGKVRVRVCPAQAGQLVTWTAGWPDRIWAVEGAPGLGRQLAQIEIHLGAPNRGDRRWPRLTRAVARMSAESAI
jgi:hypothetical protein